MTGAAPTDGRNHPEPPRGGNGKFVRSLDTAERDGKAAAMRARGASLQQIADALGYADKSHARQGITRALDATLREPAGELRAVLSDRLDTLTRKAWLILESDHWLVSNTGKIVAGPDGQPMRDSGPALAAIRELRALADQIAKLHGANAPVQVQAEIGGPCLVTLEEVEYTVTHLRQQVESERRAAGVYVTAAQDDPDGA